MTVSKGNGRRLGCAGFAQLLALMATKATIPELAVRAGVNVNTAYRFVRTMHHAGMVRILEWRPGPLGRQYPVYIAGRGKDAEAPPNAARTSSSALSSEVLGFASLLRAMQDDPTSKADLIEETGVSHTTVKTTLEACVQHGLIHIAGWAPRTASGCGQPLPLYLLGPGRAAKRPARVPAKVKQQRHYLKRRMRLRAERIAAGLAANAPTFNQAQSA